MGDEPYRRGHLYRILINPIYVGKVGHKGKVFQGQHQGIIPPEQWQSVQDQLSNAAAKPRQTLRQAADQPPSRSGTERSVLMGKLFDETGDRLTPSHANKKGRRYRYYVSHRLISKSGEKLTGDSATAGGWRLPARQLEQTVTTVICNWLNNPAQVLSDLYRDDLSAEQLNRIISGTKELNKRISNNSITLETLGTAITKVTLGSGELITELDPHEVMRLMGLSASTKTSDKAVQHSHDVITLSSPFEHRKRGIESKLLIGTNAATKPDQVLITNVAKARDWLTRIKAGTPINEIATNEHRSIKQIQRVLELAFLSPRIVKMITQGTQPPELTSRQLINTAIPMDWNQQHQKFGID